MSAMSATDVVNLLDRRYTVRSQGRDGERWVTLREARAGAGFNGNDGRCDYLAINTWPSQGMELIGHEVKVSVADWRRELDRAGKAERFARHCRRWWVVAPAKVAAVIRAELPSQWGLLAADTGRLRQVVAAPIREPAPVPDWWWVGWLATLDRARKRGDRDALEQTVAPLVEARLDAERKRMEAAASARMAHLERLAERVAEFEDATGVDIRGVPPREVAQIAALQQALRRHGDLLGSIDRAVAALAAVADAVRSEPSEMTERSLRSVR